LLLHSQIIGFGDVVSVMSDWSYFSERWQARILFRDLFWRDLIVRGTLINLLITFVGLMVVAQGYPSSWAVVSQLLVVPYNLFLVVAVLRWPGVSASYKVSAGAWFVLASLV
jgi:hypothetical protein